MKLRLAAILFVFVALVSLTMHRSANAAGDLDLSAAGCACC